MKEEEQLTIVVKLQKFKMWPEVALYALPVSARANL